MTATHHSPTTRHKDRYRVNVWCWNCGKSRDFVLDTGHWVCTTCQFVELTAEGELAEKPWGEGEGG